MTLTCPGANCPFCSGEACHVCGVVADRRDCRHDKVERHAAWSPVADDPAVARTGTPTAPLEKALLAGRIELEVGEGAEDVAEFLATMARILRTRGRVRITIE